MKYKCIKTVPGRLRAGQIYQGGFVYKTGNDFGGRGLRIIVFDDTKKFMTFNTDIFEPVD